MPASPCDTSSVRVPKLLNEAAIMTPWGCSGGGERHSLLIGTPRIGVPLTLGLLLATWPAAAHGPLFSAGPETPWKGAVEITAGYHLERASGAGETEREREAFLELEYGITPTWQINAEIPYTWKEEDGLDSDNVGDITLGTKYNFWRVDLPGAQWKASALFKTKLPTGNDESEPRSGTGSTDFIGGLAAGYEGRRWYGFVDARYRLNTEGAGGRKQGDKLFLDLVGGVRPVLTGYLEPDTVFFLELNWEYADRDELSGVALADTRGWELFISPAIWWTYRQVAIKGGVQIPIAGNLNGNQPSSDYRALIELVYHF